MNTVLTKESQGYKVSFTHRGDEFRIVAEDKTDTIIAKIPHKNINIIRTQKVTSFQGILTVTINSLKRKIELFTEEKHLRLTFSEEDWSIIWLYMTEGTEGNVATFIDNPKEDM